MPQEHELYLHKLPVRFDSMVYFLRRYLKIYYLSDTRLDYAAIANFPGKSAFEYQMKELREKL